MTTREPEAQSVAEERLHELESKVTQLEHDVNKAQGEDAVSIVCFSGEWDRLFAAFTIAHGALAMEKEVHMFFTFWGATALRKAHACSGTKRSWIQKMLGMMLPADLSAAPLSKMNFCGLGKVMMNRLIRDKGVDDLESLVNEAREMGAHFHCCEMSLRLFGWGCEDLVDGDASDWCGVSAFMANALKSRVTLFI